MFVVWKVSRKRRGVKAGRPGWWGEQSWQYRDAFKMATLARCTWLFTNYGWLMGNQSNQYVFTLAKHLAGCCCVVLYSRNWMLCRCCELPMCVDVCVCTLLSPRHGWTGRVRSHERTIHEDRGGLPARLLSHRQRKVSDTRLHSCTSLSPPVCTPLFAVRSHTLFPPLIWPRCPSKTSALIPCH